LPALTLTGPVAGSAAAATGIQAQTIESGVDVQVGTNLQAVSANANTTPQTPAFCVQQKDTGGEATLEVAAVGIGGLPTTVTANLLRSVDGGLTWQTFATALPLFASGVGAISEAIHVTPGLYALALSALALGGATGVNLVVTRS
jgi:hypothetical protein